MNYAIMELALSAFIRCIEGVVNMNGELLKNENYIKIFNTAEELFYKKGYSNTSVDEIIEKSGTSKGTFYYYYKHKADLGVSVLINSHQQHTNTLDVFSEVRDLVLIALDIRVFWYAYYHDEGFRRFHYDISKHSLEYQSDYIVKTCLANTKKRFSKLELELILETVLGMRHKISLHVYNKLQMFPYQMIADYSMRQIFRLFEIPNKVIKETMKESQELFDQLDIEIEKFSFHLKLNQEKDLSLS